MKKANPENMDLTDPIRDQQRLGGDQGTLNLPELKDIPGQEKINPSSLVPPGDTTVSSADEEGDDVLEDEDEASEISSLDKQLLDESFDPNDDTDFPVNQISLDDRDESGEKLEESGPEDDLFGEDLDDDLIEEEDEESEGEH